jgi:hypothetical protein
MCGGTNLKRLRDGRIFCRFSVQDLRTRLRMKGDSRGGIVRADNRQKNACTCSVAVKRPALQQFRSVNEWTCLGRGQICGMATRNLQITPINK